MSSCGLAAVPAGHISAPWGIRQKIEVHEHLQKIFFPLTCGLGVVKLLFSLSDAAGDALKEFPWHFDDLTTAISLEIAHLKHLPGVL